MITDRTRRGFDLLGVIASTLLVVMVASHFQYGGDGSAASPAWQLSGVQPGAPGPIKPIALAVTGPPIPAPPGPPVAAALDPFLPAVSVPATPAAGGISIGLDPILDLRARRLDVPVQGIARETLRDSFSESRGSHEHEAIDILAPRNTPVVAVEDGTIAKLFYSAYGGITVYQFDPTKAFVYYYAHLERYSDTVREAQPVKRGDVLGYVGTSGNAPKNTPHLHFAIFRLTAQKQWWDGTALDPYNVLK